MRVPSFPQDTRVHLPFCLFPSEFPKEWFKLVESLQIHINFVLHRISNSFELLKECLSSSLESDQFIKNLFDIYEAVYESRQKLQLGIIRCDYLLHCNINGEVDCIRQVENNTISSALCGVSPKMRDLYVAVFQKAKIPELATKLPHNDSCIKVAEGLVSAWEYYGKKSSVILFIVNDCCFNICDQREIEFQILEQNRDINVVRQTLKELRKSISLKDKLLFVNNSEVSVVYYRTGYVPEQYEPQDWNTRFLIEQSLSIKCPSVGLHLAGTKCVQQFLTRKGVLEMFLPFGECETLRQVFAGQYLLKNKMNSSIISHALKYPEKYVLKAEREGGGNNMYGEDVKNYLEKLLINDDNSCILMERIVPPAISNCIVRSNDTSEISKVTSELGIFGVILGSDDIVKFNYTAGHLLRSKEEYRNEGGVASGNGALDYVYLV